MNIKSNKSPLDIIKQNDELKSKLFTSPNIFKNDTIIFMLIDIQSKILINEFKVQ